MPVFYETLNCNQLKRSIPLFVSKQGKCFYCKMPRVFHQPLKEEPETEAQLPTTSVTITVCPIVDDQQTENCVEGSYIQCTNWLKGDTNNQNSQDSRSN